MSTEPESRTRPSSLRQQAVVVDPRDNVAVLKKGVSGDAILSVPGRPELRVASAVSDAAKKSGVARRTPRIKQVIG